MALTFHGQSLESELVTAAEPTFFVTGGTLRQDARSYVERQADKDLLDGLLAGDFCYVLTSRQMGKSSLMVHTAGKLRQRGLQVVTLDLTALGQNLTPEQWYDGLLSRMSRQLRIEDELESFWDAHHALGPCQRFFAALEEVVLPRASAISNQSSASGGAADVKGDSPKTGSLNTGHLVIFVDELDVVRSLPFSTDEFFAAIRECYNRRAEDANWERLTFCLLGVASPSDLIRDMRLTPFNIGKRIELNDFTPEEAGALTRGLKSKFATEGSALLLERVMYWTNGHPYLTQRLCQTLAQGLDGPGESSGVRAGVDGVCASLFLSPRARGQDDNLLFVRERLLRAEADRAAVLTLYEQIVRRKRVPDDQADPMVSALRLSGVTRASGGRLVVRNRIYERVFDREWTQASMPEAELRRQQAAFRRGALRAAGIAGLFILFMAGVVGIAMRQTRRAEEATQALRRNVYASDMRLAQVHFEENNFGRAAELVQKHFPAQGQEDLRGFEWRYLWKHCQGDEICTFYGHSNSVCAVAFSPDGRVLASIGWDRRARVWDLKESKLLRILTSSKPLFPALGALTFSPDGKWMAGPCTSGVVVWETSHWREQMVLNADLGTDDTDYTAGPTKLNMRFSTGGRRLVCECDRSQRFHLWDTETWQKAPLGSKDWSSLRSSAVSRNLQLLATLRAGGRIEIWNLTSEELIVSVRARLIDVWCLTFSGDGNLLAAGDSMGRVEVWQTHSGREVGSWRAHANWIMGLAFSPDGKMLATGGGDQLVCLWDAANLTTNTPVVGSASEELAPPKLATLRGHRDQVWSLDFSADGSMLASGSQDGTVKLWNVASRPQQESLISTAKLGWLSPDGGKLISALRDGTLQTWDVPTGNKERSLKLPLNPETLSGGAISPDGRQLAFGLTNGDVQIWNPQDATLVATLRGHHQRVRTTAFSGNSQKLATWAEEGVTRVWDVNTGTALAGLKSAGPGELSPDGNLLATIEQGGAQLVEVATGRKLAEFTAHRRPIDRMRFSPDGRLLVTAGADKVVRVWTVPSGQPFAALEGHIAGNYDVVFSPDGRTLVTGANYDSIKLWNLATKQEVLTLREPGINEGRVLFSEGGTVLAAGYLEGPNGIKQVKCWSVPTLAEIEVKEKLKNRAPP